MIDDVEVQDYLCKSVAFLNPRDVVAIYIIDKSYFILLSNGINLSVTKKDYNTAVNTVNSYYKKIQEKCED